MTDGTILRDRSMALLANIDALRLVSPFLGEGWASTFADAVEVARATSGIINILRLAGITSRAVREPSAVFVRHSGLVGEHKEPAGVSVNLSTAQQAIVRCEMAWSGWESQVYGIFSGGKVEEYVDAHPFSAAESSKPAIRTGVARSFARLHLFEVPLCRDGSEPANAAFKNGVVRKRQKVLNALQSIDDPRARLYTATSRSADWAAALGREAGMFTRHDRKKAVAHDDANLLYLLGSDPVECNTWCCLAVRPSGKHAYTVSRVKLG